MPMNLEQYLESVCGVWNRQIKLCRESKETQFSKTADKLWSFLGKSYRQLYQEGEEDLSFAQARNPWYKTRVSKSAEAVALLVPWVLSRVPHRVINPRRPPMPQEVAAVMPEAAQFRQQVDARDNIAAYLQQWFLNWTPTEYGLKREARTTLPEAFVKGRGVLWHEMVESPAGMIPSSQFMSVDDLLIDSDTIKPKDAGFILRKRRRSVWQVAAEFGYDREHLRSMSKSNSQKATEDKETGAKSNDVCEYYEVYSRIGIGNWLDQGDEQFKELSEALEELGQHVWLAILPGMKHPLNLNPAALATADTVTAMKERLQWPIPFYADMAGNPWPCSLLDFYPHQTDPWSDSPLQPGLPMQIYLDHLYSFAMSHVRVTSRNIIVFAAALEESFKTVIREGMDLETVVVSGEPGVDVSKLFKVIEWPKLNEDLWQVAGMVERAYERATGLDPLLYGAESSRQMRSAKEAGIREAHVSSRPDDYADAVEDWMSAAGAKELQATRLMVDVRTVAPMFGEVVPSEEDPEAVPGPMTQAWIELVQTDDPYQAAAEFSCTVEAGSARRQNKQKQVADLELTVQTLGQPLLGMAMQGVPGPFNALIEMLGEAQGIDVTRLMVPEGLSMGEEGEEGEEAEG